MNKQFFPYNLSAEALAKAERTNRIFCKWFVVSLSILTCIAYGNSGAAGQSGSSTDFSGLTVPVSAGSPRSPTAPVSSYNARQTYGGAVPSPPVSGTSYYRGLMPYTNRYDFVRNLEPTSLDSFTRYSSAAGQPFYSPSALTLSSGAYQTTASATGWLAPSDKIRSDNTATQILYPMVGSTDSSSAPLVSRYSLSSFYNQSQTGLLDRVSGHKTPEQFLYTQPESLLPVQADTAYSQLPSVSDSVTDILKPVDTTDRDKKTQQQTPDIFGQIKAQIDQLDQQLKQQTIKEASDQKIKDTIAEQWKEKLKMAQGDTSSLPQQQKTKPPTDTIQPKTRASAATKPLPRTPEAEQMFEEKFNQCMLSALQLLRQGDFYQAADAFTWASLYRPSEPAGYVGKGIALFAAGEYMTASRLVAAGLNLSADFAKTKLDLADMLGGKEKVDSRIADLDKCSKAGNAGELYFLLAFIQLNSGQSEQAKASIDEAERKTPDENVVKALKTIIYQPAEK